MKCSVFIATSADGFIATADGSVDWLHSSGDQSADMGEQAHMGFNDFLASVDCIIMGRKCMEVISNMNLTPEQWPYGNLRIVVLSNSMSHPPSNLDGKVEMYSGDLLKLVDQLSSEGHQHAYIDGGKTIQAFLNLELINSLTITRAPILLGEGIPLFGKTEKSLKLTNSSAAVFPNDFIQVRYSVNY